MDFISKILSGTISEDDLKMAVARKTIEDALKTPEYRRYLTDLHNENLHTKGWSKDKQFKARCEIPFDALAYLPEELKKDTRKLAKWIKANYPILHIGR